MKQIIIIYLSIFYLLVKASVVAFGVTYTVLEHVIMNDDAVAPEALDE